MNIPPYWSRARYPEDGQAGKDRAVACGWSFTSLADARLQAVARAKRVFELLHEGKKPETYEYADRPVKEEILKELSDGTSVVALITRNRYGALVLNTANVLFADVDFPRVSSGGILEALLALFRPGQREARREAAALKTIQGIEVWARENPTRSFRLYRTREGLRLLFTDKLYEPAAEETLGLLKALAADPMYIKLTRKQACFRARLTAKPWRCGCPLPPNAFPREGADAARAFRQWEGQYTKADAACRVCEFVKAFGRAADLPAFRAVVAAHDLGTRIESTEPLA